MIVVLFNIVGCSNKEMYNTLRLNERIKCANEPLPFTTYQKCVERSKKSYEEYESERKEAMDGYE